MGAASITRPAFWRFEVLPSFPTRRSADLGSAGGHVELSWSYQVSRLICVITDEASEPPVITSADEMDESGHGLQIVGALARSEEHTSELQSLRHLVCRLLLEIKTQDPWRL